MPIDVRWDDDLRTIMLVEYIAPWTWEELHQAQARGNRMSAEIDHPFDMIQDMSSTPHLPSGAFVNIKTLVSRLDPKLRVTVYVGMQPSVRAVWSSFASLHSALTGKRKFHFARTLAEAYGIVETVQHREKLVM